MNILLGVWGVMNVWWSLLIEISERDKRDNLALFTVIAGKIFCLITGLLCLYAAFHL